MAPTTPTVVLVPGMSSVASVVYAPLVERLKARGLEEVRPVNLPSVDCVATKASLKPNALEADIAVIRSVLVKLVEGEGKDVVAVAHSYGGTPTLCACEGLWRDGRRNRREKGGVVRAVLLSSSLTLPGRAIAADRIEYGEAHGGINDEGAKIEVVGEVSCIQVRLRRRGKVR